MEGRDILLGRPLVIVVWKDAESINEWTSIDDFKRWIDEEPEVVNSVGWLVRNDDAWVIIVATVGDDEVGEAMKIPKRWVQDIRTILMPTKIGGSIEGNKYQEPRSVPAPEWRAVEPDGPRPG